MAGCARNVLGFNRGDLVRKLRGDWVGYSKLAKKFRLVHVFFLAAFVLTAVASYFVVAKKYFKAKAHKEINVASSSILNYKAPKNVHLKDYPEVNSFDRQFVINEINEKYDKARNIIKTNYFKESAAKNHAAPNSQSFYNTEEYHKMLRAYEIAKTQLDGQQAVELCEKTQFMCDKARDYKQLRRRIASVDN